MLVNVLPFASAPGKVGVHYLPDGNFVALNGIDAGGIKLGEEFCPLASNFFAGILTDFKEKLGRPGGKRPAAWAC